jgi:hypothetical protein
VSKDTLAGHRPCLRTGNRFPLGTREMSSLTAVGPAGVFVTIVKSVDGSDYGETAIMVVAAAAAAAGNGVEAETGFAGGGDALTRDIETFPCAVPPTGRMVVAEGEVGPTVAGTESNQIEASAWWTAKKDWRFAGEGGPLGCFGESLGLATAQWEAVGAIAESSFLERSSSSTTVD